MCAIATARLSPCWMLGCAFVHIVEPVVEYRVCPIAACPSSPRSFSSEKTCATRPMSRSAISCPSSETAIPADSWPRCWSATSPKCVSRATSRSGAWIPKIPHISREPARPFSYAIRSSETATPRSASPLTVPICRNGTSVPSASATISRASPATIAWPAPSPKSVTASGPSASSAPAPAAIAHSASATARPPSDASWTHDAWGATAARNDTSDASAARSGSAGRPAGPSRNRAWYSEPSRRSSGAPARNKESPSRQCPGTRRTSVDEPDTADDRRRMDREPVGLVVERDVSGDDRDSERLAGERHPLDRLRELPGDLGLLGIPEVEAVGEGERMSPGARDVPYGFEHGEHAPRARIQERKPPGAVERNRQPSEGGPELEHRGVESRPPYRPRLDELVVLPVDPRAAREVRRGEQLEEPGGRRLPCRGVHGPVEVPFAHARPDSADIRR